MKKILVSLTVLALMLTAAGSASAICFFNCGGSSDGQIVKDSGATVNNNVSATSRTGRNDIRNESGSSDDNTIMTGSAIAYATADNFVNSNSIEGCCDGNDQEVNDSGATVNNTVRAKAGTGRNDIRNEGGNSDDNTIMTGSAYADALAQNTVNSNLVEGCCEAGDQEVDDSGATVNNTVRAKARTGDNDIKNSGCWLFGGRSDDNTIMTGPAESWSSAFTTVNSNVLRFR